MPTAQQDKNAGREIRTLQALRGFAACMVVVYHATQHWCRHIAGTPLPHVWENGASGVDLFFVISGLVMALTSHPAASGRNPALTFLERRIVRVVPLYWIVTAVTLLKMLALRFSPQLENGSEHIATPFGYILASLLFVPYRNSAGAIQPLVIVGWTLSFEMFFYLLFALALALRAGLLGLLTPVMIGLAIAGFFLPANAPSATVLLSPLLLEFLAGVYIGTAARAGFDSNRRLAMAVGVSSLACLLLVPVIDPNMRILLWGLPAALVVLCALTLERTFGGLIPHIVLLIGDASYSLYLSHLLVFNLAVKLLGRAGLLPPSDANFWKELASVATLLLLSILGGILVYRLVERPINDAMRKQLALRKIQPVCAG